MQLFALAYLKNTKKKCLFHPIQNRFEWMNDLGIESGRRKEGAEEVDCSSSRFLERAWRYKFLVLKILTVTIRFFCLFFNILFFYIFN